MNEPIAVVLGMEDVPVAFTWRGRSYVVREVLDHWRERRAWWRISDSRPVTWSPRTWRSGSAGRRQPRPGPRDLGLRPGPVARLAPGAHRRRPAPTSTRLTHTPPAPDRPRPSRRSPAHPRRSTDGASPRPPRPDPGTAALDLLYWAQDSLLQACHAGSAADRLLPPIWAPCGAPQRCSPPGPEARRGGPVRTVWLHLGSIAPEVAEWADYFALAGQRRTRDRRRRDAQPSRGG